ncbi:uncharacterized protein G2W53_007893 [Senna tora]|uniref:Uncharacterized protein n=1 Tax=Senna tora TaxID=362788 RepID=A0A835CE52_9FABA|nr:uncharacterized protein G2W53_007893 [Senna tora]
MHGVGVEGKQVGGILGMFKVKGSMAFWCFGSGERYETFKVEGKVFADKDDVFRVMGNLGPYRAKTSSFLYQGICTIGMQTRTLAPFFPSYNTSWLVHPCAFVLPSLDLDFLPLVGGFPPLILASNKDHTCFLNCLHDSMECPGLPNDRYKLNLPGTMLGVVLSISFLASDT